jgi:putative nucleotidyltransferase with HDIG domain
MNTTKAAMFVSGIALLGVVVSRLGFTLVETVVIVALAGLLSALVTRMPWGGFLFPGDALVLCLCFITGSNLVALGAVGAGIASAGLVTGRKWAAVVMSVRNAVAVFAAIALWTFMVPAEAVISEGRRAIPGLLVVCLAFVMVASILETLMRRRRDGGLGDYWLANFGHNFHHLIFTAILGALLAVAYSDLGLPALVLFTFPVVLTRDALKRSLDLRASRIEALKALSSSVDARDRYTYDHSNRVSRLAGMLAREMGFTEDMVEAIEGGALLHDIGKLSVDTEILGKPGPLDDDEWAVVREHPQHSADVVSRVELLKRSVSIVKHHHERPDGRGYPAGLKGYEIPVGARILNVADAFDAMISDRPYRQKKSVEQALEELRKGSGSEFDPVVVEYLTRLLHRHKSEFAGHDAN